MSGGAKKDDLETGTGEEGEIPREHSVRSKTLARVLSYGGNLDEEEDDYGSKKKEEDEESSSGCLGRCGDCCSSFCEQCKSFCCSCCTDERKNTAYEKIANVTGTKARLSLNQNGKVYAYDHELLLSWRVFFGWSGTIFVQRAVYIIIPYVCCVAITCFVACYVGIPHARKLDTGRFNDFVNYIKVFIAFMLGLFLNNAFKRWWSSVSYFKRFLVSIKQLMYTMQAIGVPPQLYNECERLTIASSYILNDEVHCAQLTCKKVRAERWRKALDHLVEKKYLTKDERHDLEEQSGCDTGTQATLGVMSTIMWIWVGESMTQVKDSVTGPMYVRLVFLCQDCLAQVELLKTNLIVQLPFTYVHMLCCLVHLANLLMALSSGLTIGSAVAEVHSRQAEYHEGVGPDEFGAEGGLFLQLAHVIGMTPGASRAIKGFYEAIQTLGVNLVMLLLQPLLYQSFLVIAHALCYPYGSGICHMPTETFITQMHYEMQVMAAGAHNQKKRLIKKLKRENEGGVTPQAGKVALHLPTDVTASTTLAETSTQLKALVEERKE